MKWFDRDFNTRIPPELFSSLRERIRGTPVRVEHLLSQIAPQALTVPSPKRWSIQENVGHLQELEPLWQGRLEDLLGGVSELRPADLKNTATDKARYNERDISKVLNAFRAARQAFTARLEGISSQDLIHSATHPRLETRMAIPDLLFFIAEHDDHHLARIADLGRAMGAMGWSRADD